MLLSNWKDNFIKNANYCRNAEKFYFWMIIATLSQHFMINACGEFYQANTWNRYLCILSIRIINTHDCTSFLLHNCENLSIWRKKCLFCVFFPIERVVFIFCKAGTSCITAFTIFVWNAFVVSTLTNCLLCILWRSMDVFQEVFLS